MPLTQVQAGMLSTGAPSWDSNGNVGIGTTSPVTKLDVTGIATVRNNSAAFNTTPNTNYGLNFQASSTGVTYITSYSSGGSTDIAFATNSGGGAAAERARIDSSGRLLVGTTSAPGQTGGVIVANNELFVYNIPTTASGANCNISSGEGNRFYRSTSALKYKQDIRDLESIDIGKFRPVRYKSKCENDDQTKDYIGVIADEVAAEGIEELVTRGANDEIEGFQYERLTVVLLKELQEHKAMIEELKAKVAALEK
jgi:hypothetical protein